MSPQNGTILNAVSIKDVFFFESLTLPSKRAILKTLSMPNVTAVEPFLCGLLQLEAVSGHLLQSMQNNVVADVDFLIVSSSLIISPENMT